MRGERKEAVSAKRLAWGIDGKEGDIHAAYSADRISEAKPIRNPFAWRGAAWCTVGTGSGGAYAYKLTPKQLFKEPATTYAKKVFSDAGETARADPRGFYHGMEVRYSGAAYVLTGPEVAFVAEEAAIELPEPELDREYRTRLEAERASLELKQKSAKKFALPADGPLFSDGPAQQSLF